jgi:hypothetical protein
MVYSVLEFREEKQIFAKVGGDNVDFFQTTITVWTIQKLL